MSSTQSVGASSYESVTEKMYNETGKTEDKEKAAEDMQELTEQTRLPSEDYDPGEWKKPICTLYECFSNWLDKTDEQGRAVSDSAKTNINFSWYMSGNSISIWDIDKYKKELFSTEDAQEAYKQYLSGEAGVNGDPIGIKFQTGNIMADERAFRLRHNSIANSLACGLMAKNRYTIMRDIYSHTVNSIREQCDKQWEALHKDQETSTSSS